MCAALERRGAVGRLYKWQEVYDHEEHNETSCCNWVGGGKPGAAYSGLRPSAHTDAHPPAAGYCRRQRYTHANRVAWCYFSDSDSTPIAYGFTRPR